MEEIEKIEVKTEVEDNFFILATFTDFLDLFTVLKEKYYKTSESGLCRKTDTYKLLCAIQDREQLIRVMKEIRQINRETYWDQNMVSRIIDQKMLERERKYIALAKTLTDTYQRPEDFNYGT